MTDNDTPDKSLFVEEDKQVRRERQNSSKYRKLYTDLLLRHQGLIQNARKHEHSDEAQRIQSMIESEQKALAVGFCAGVALFSALRIMPRYLIRRFASAEKNQALAKADEQAKKEGYYNYQRIFAITIEGSFSLWIANQTYQYQSKRSNGAYETLAKIPLCKGRSVIAESICDDWTRITTRQIPTAFWQSLKTKDGIGGDERSWHAILEFSINCQRRARFEAKLRKAMGEKKDEAGDDDDTSVSRHISLPMEVPEDGGDAMSIEEARKLVQG